MRACYVPPILDTRYWGYSYMKYSYEYKRMRVELYRQGKWPETPEGLQRFGAHLPDHAPGVEKAVVGGQAGQLVAHVAGDQERDALLPVQL